MVIEADGGSRGNPGPAGYGAVVIDADTGELLAERSGFLGVATNNVAEYSGLLAGLRAAHALSPSAAVHVRMDSKLVVEQMSGRWQIKHPALRPLATEAARVLPGDRVSYEWIPRAQNKRADRLANQAMDAGQRGEVPPGGVVEGPEHEAEAGAERDVYGAGVAPSAEGPVYDAGTGVQAAPNRHREAVTVAVPEARPRHTTPRTAAPDMGTPATLVLLRHGETPLTPEKRFSGSGGSDPSLSPVGREQAARVAEALARRGTIEVIVASPLARTRETAEAVATRLGLDVAVDDGLRETDFGAWEGLTFREVRERHPEDMAAWLGDQAARPTGGGESFAEVAERIAATRDRLTSAYAGRTVLVVSHVTPIKTLVRLALGAPPEALFRMDLAAASLSAVAYYADGNASVRLLNDTSHLR
ncbi:bifunctional RNase H/acid phosphatase [Streptomyces sp. ST1015]|uniref:bifunctional RNase H/acid phosphatase n=1 Tax=Streptomyces sp. ST1015 TaxID=1848900 RepID=UPI000DDAEDC8|nr:MULTISPECIES: bifunctional RNase H/acid phosphatase [unclassified Streptomyces]QZZ32684.1 bifunctional RNase H/acid phosphatase [Streptomyces sp. ST1015]